MGQITYVIDKETGEKFAATYALNRYGNLRMFVNGKFHSDRDFDKKYIIIKQSNE
jgi:hypothetical protein